MFTRKNDNVPHALPILQLLEGMDLSESKGLESDTRVKRMSREAVRLKPLKNILPDVFEDKHQSMCRNPTSRSELRQATMVLCKVLEPDSLSGEYVWDVDSHQDQRAAKSSSEGAEVSDVCQTSDYLFAETFKGDAGLLDPHLPSQFAGRAVRDVHLLRASRLETTYPGAMHAIAVANRSSGGVASLHDGTMALDPRHFAAPREKPPPPPARTFPIPLPESEPDMGLLALRDLSIEPPR